MYKPAKNPHTKSSKGAFKISTPDKFSKYQECLTQPGVINSGTQNHKKPNTTTNNSETKESIIKSLRKYQTIKVEAPKPAIDETKELKWITKNPTKKIDPNTPMDIKP